MSIFRKKTVEVDLFPPNENEKVMEFKNSKTVVRLDDHFIRIARKNSLTNLVLKGLDGEKSILLSEITAYQLKKPGKTTGYLQIIYPGSLDDKGGMWNAVQDENTIVFTKEEVEHALVLKEAIENSLIKKHR
jgi:hypothetical protein